LCHNSWDNFKTTWFPSGKEPSLRNPDTAYIEHKQTLDDLTIHGKKKDAKAKLKANGWCKHLSPIWQLQWVRFNFYKCFGICTLHLLLLGISKVTSAVS